MSFKKLSNIVTDFLIFTDRHQHGILITVIVHLAIFTSLLIVKIKQTQIPDTSIVLDFTQQRIIENELIEERETPIENNNIDQEYARAVSEMRNLPVNRSSEDIARDNIGKMVDDIKQELNVNDANYQRMEEEIEPDEPNSRSISMENDRKTSDSKTVGNTIYQGPTTLSYDLLGRTHVHMSVPVYMCKGSGEVVVSIVVNPKGNVISAAVLSSRISDNSTCFTDAALTAARASRFNIDANAEEKQKGTITYVFLPQ